MQLNPTLSVLQSKWSDVAIGLGVPLKRINKIRNDVLVDKLGLNDALYQILEEWVARERNNATLNKLLHILQLNKLNDIGGTQAYSIMKWLKLFIYK